MRLLRFQTESVNEVEWFNGRALIANDMGTGKTFTALSTLKTEHLPAVVVCPAAVKYHWEREALRAIGLRASVLEGQQPSDPTTVAGAPRLVVVNYDVLQYWVDWLRRIRPRTVILDECQKISNQTARRTKATLKLCRGVDRVLALSGTPMLNRPIELWTVLHLLNPDVFDSRWDFAQRFCSPEWTPWGWSYRGASNTEDLHRLLSNSVLIRRRKNDVLDLPSKIREAVPLPISDRNEYQRANLDFAAWLHRQDPVAAARALKAEALTKVGYLLRLSARLKMPYVLEWVNNWLEDTDEKLVVFAVHREMIQQLRHQIKARCVVVDGTVTGRQRQGVVDQFQHDNRVRVLVGNLQAAGVGLTLTAASTVVMTELAWRPGDHTQAEDRCHRIGARDTVWIHYLVARGTVEERLCSLIQEKQQVLSATIDGGPVSGDLDVFDRLLESLKDEK